MNKNVTLSLLVLLLLSLFGSLSYTVTFMYVPALFFGLIGFATLICIALIVGLFRVQNPEAADKRRSELMNAALDSISDAIVACDKYGKLILFNDAGKNLHQKEQAPIFPEQWAQEYNLYYPDSDQLLKIEDIPLYRAWKGQKVVNQIFSTKNAAGDRRKIVANGKPILSRAGEIKGAIISMHDITALEEADYFRQLADESPLMIWRSDKNGFAEYVNKTWTEFTGISFENSLGHKFSVAFHPEDASREFETWTESIKNLRTHTSAFRLKRHDGEYRYVWAQATPYYVLGEYRGYIGSVVDVTDQEKVKQSLQNLISKQDEFISVASHELKTPITGMKGYLQILQSIAAKEGNVKYADFISKANKQVDKLTSLVTDLLNVSNIQAGKMMYRFSEFGLSEILEDTLAYARQASPEHHITVEGDSEVKVIGDKNRLEQVLNNLISNAIKYSPNSDKITLNINRPVEELLEIKVIDFGIGIQKDKMPYLFDRFFRVDEDSINFSGLGIGLYIASEIVKRHSGKMGVESTAGEGSTFWFTIPLCPPLEN